MSKLTSKKETQSVSGAPSVPPQRIKPRALAPIPPDPRPTKEEIDIELQKQNGGVKSLPQKMRLQFAELAWYAAAKEESPDLFCRPFAPEPMSYEVYLDSNEWRRISRAVKKAAGETCACCPNKATQVAATGRA